MVFEINIRLRLVYVIIVWIMSQIGDDGLVIVAEGRARLSQCTIFVFDISIPTV